MSTILIFSHKNEPVTKTLLDRLQNIYPISLRDFLDKASVFDEVSESGVSVSWEFPDGKVVKNCKSTYLINRVFGISDELFVDFVHEDQQYAKSEFRAYLMFALSAFPKAFGQPGAFGLNENRYSLPRQWEMIHKLKTKLATPEYFLGNLADYTNHPRLVCSNPNNYYYWRPSVKDSSFAFVKPDGVPVVSSIVGKDVRIYQCEKSFSLTCDQANKIKLYSIQIAKLFSYRIFEILFFVNGKTICFGMSSPIPYYSSKIEGFQNRIIDYFNNII